MTLFQINHAYLPQYLVRLSEIVLAIILAVVVADLVWLLFSPTDAGEDRAPPSAQVAVQTGPATPANNGAQHLSPAVLSLFGQPQQSYPNSAYQEEELRETGLDLTLKGILAHRASSRKLALISHRGEEETVYHIGNQIAGAKIIQIEARRVILERNGVREVLTIKVAKPRSGGTSSLVRTPESRTER